MRRLIARWRRMMLLWLVGCCLSVTIVCGACAPKAVVVPDSRDLVDLTEGSPARPGWYGISAGYLREIFRDLETCAGGAK